MTYKGAKLLITLRFPEAVLTRAKRDYVCTFNDKDIGWSEDEIIEKANDHDGILCSSTNRFTRAVVDRLPKSIRIIATYSVGFEHLDINALKTLGISATNTPDVLSKATADIAFMLLLCASRRAGEAERMVRNSMWEGWTPTQLLGPGLQGKCLGILGMGNIGREVATRARAFGMKIHYHNRSRLKPNLEKDAIYHDKPENLLQVSEFLSLNCPMSEEMRYFINAETLKLLPPNSVLINSARGGLVDDSALIAALKSGRLFAAGLDVFDKEPDVNPAYFELDNVFMTPHIGSATIETRDAMGFRALDNLDQFFAGKTPIDLIT